MELLQISKMAPAAPLAADPRARSVLATAVDGDAPFTEGGPTSTSTQAAVTAKQMQLLQNQLQQQQVQLAHQAGTLTAAQQNGQQQRPARTKRLTPAAH